MVNDELVKSAEAFDPRHLASLAAGGQEPVWMPEQGRCSEKTHFQACPAPFVEELHQESGSVSASAGFLM